MEKSKKEFVVHTRLNVDDYSRLQSEAKTKKKSAVIRQALELFFKAAEIFDGQGKR